MIMENNIEDLLKILKSGDYIAFGFNYNGGEPNELIVSNITQIYEDKVLVHFAYGHHSLGEFVKKTDIIAIGDMNSNGKIEGWSGKFNIIQPEHKLLIED